MEVTEAQSNGSAVHAEPHRHQPGPDPVADRCFGHDGVYRGDIPELLWDRRRYGNDSSSTGTVDGYAAMVLVAVFQAEGFVIKDNTYCAIRIKQIRP